MSQEPEPGPNTHFPGRSPGSGGPGYLSNQPKSTVHPLTHPPARSTVPWVQWEDHRLNKRCSDPLALGWALRLE